MLDLPSPPLMSRENTTLFVVAPQMRECAMDGGWGTEKTEAAVDTIVSIVPAFRRAGVPVVWLWARLDETGTLQEPQDLPADAPAFLRLTADMETSLGGIHPKIKPLMLDGHDTVSHKYNQSALHMPNIRAMVAARGAGHNVLAGFNYNVCVTMFGLGLRSDKGLPPQGVTILSDASADNHDREMAEMYSDCGIGESMNAAMRRALGIGQERSVTVMGRLGI